MPEIHVLGIEDAWAQLNTKPHKDDTRRRGPPIVSPNQHRLKSHQRWIKSRQRWLKSRQQSKNLPKWQSPLSTDRFGCVQETIS